MQDFDFYANLIKFYPNLLGAESPAPSPLALSLAPREYDYFGCHCVLFEIKW